MFRRSKNDKDTAREYTKIQLWDDEPANWSVSFSNFSKIQVYFHEIGVAAVGS